MLGYEPYIKSFEYIIRNSNKLMNLPIVFGIHGKWGVGKSTFMDLIKFKLYNCNDYYTLEINPWEYANEYNFISVFLAELFRTIKNDLDYEQEGKEDSVLNFFKTICKPLKLSSNFSGIKAEYDFSKLTFNSQKDLVEKYITENYQLKETIHKILDYEIFDSKKIVIFIDDLDRCPEDKVLEVIESIKLILNSKNCIFFLGCDKEYLESALSVKYKDFISFMENSSIEKNIVFKKFADEYLEKIIQIPFYIPSLNEEAVKSYIGNLLNSSNDDEMNNEDNLLEENFYDKFKQLINTDLLSKLFIEINFNPRRMKRILNITFLNYLFIQFKNLNNSLKKNDVDLLILLGLIRDGYPIYYKTKLLSEIMCKRTFQKMFTYYKSNSTSEESNLSEDDKKVLGLFKIFFELLGIQSNHKLEDLLNNISIILTISKTTSSENFDTIDWGEIGEIKSKTGTNKTLKSFLNRMKNNDTITDFLLWFFGDVYNKEEFYIGIQKNIHFYKNSVNGHYENFIFKIYYNDYSERLFIKFKSGTYNSGVNYQDVLKNESYYDENNKQIIIDREDSDEIINKIKNSIYELLENS